MAQLDIKEKYHGILLKTCLYFKKNYPRSCNNYGKKGLGMKLENHYKEDVISFFQNNLCIKDVEVFSSIEDAISSARTTDLEPIIIGGSSIYTQAMPFVTKSYLTEVNLTVTADTFFIWNRNDWKEIFRQKRKCKRNRICGSC